MPARERLVVNSNKPVEKCHILPCFINYDGVVDTSKLEMDLTPSHLRTTLRGRPLQGREVDLEKLGYIGYTLGEEPPNNTENDMDEYEETIEDAPLEKTKQLVPIGGSFSQLIVWEHGRPPKTTDPWGEKLEQLLTFARCLS